MKNKKFIIESGSICVVDPDNTLKNSVIGPITVVVLKKSKRKHFKQYWLVQNTINEKETFEISEDLLYPSNTTVIRLPVDLPIFTEHDLAVLDFAIQTTKDARLGKIREKILLAMKLREV